MGVDVSSLQTQTVSEHMQRMYNTDIVPFDESLNLASRFPTPEETVIDEEYRREIREAVNSLSSPYREVLEALCECMEEDPTRNSLPTYQTITQKFNELNAGNPDVPVMDADMLKRAFEIASKQFMGKYNVTYRRHELNINSGLLLEEIDNDRNDIIAAVEADPRSVLTEEADEDMEILIFGRNG